MTEISYVREEGYWCLYELGQAYGGPEEGGWWYETGYLVGIRSAVREYWVDRCDCVVTPDGQSTNYPGPSEEVLNWAKAKCEKLGLQLDGRSRYLVYNSGPEDAGLYWRREDDGIPTDFPTCRPSYE